MLAGSDAGDLYSLAGFSIHHELEMMVEAGLSPREALRAATLGAAGYLDATDSPGTVREGRVADLVLLGGDPLVDIRNSRTIRAVVRAGALVRSCGPRRAAPPGRGGGAAPDRQFVGPALESAGVPTGSATPLPARPQLTGGGLTLMMNSPSRTLVKITTPLSKKG